MFLLSPSLDVPERGSKVLSRVLEMDDTCIIVSMFGMLVRKRPKEVKEHESNHSPSTPV